LTLNLKILKYFYHFSSLYNSQLNTLKKYTIIY